MGPHFNRVSIIGVGLLGASFGLALKQRGLADHIIGVGRRQSSLDTALRAGAIDESSLDLASAVQDANLVLLAAPAAQVLEHLDQVRQACGPDAIVADVASTKGAICGRAQATWPAPRRFIGCHPMAGSHQFGPEHGRANFYEDTVCLVEEGDSLDPGARAQVAALWQALGAEVIAISPARHDAVLAHTSHVPHILAAALAEAAARQGGIGQLIGQGFRDMTRIAASRPEVWRDICLTNRDAILEALAAFNGRLDTLAAALAQNDAAAVEDFFVEGKKAREKALGE